MLLVLGRAPPYLSAMRMLLTLAAAAGLALPCLAFPAAATAQTRAAHPPAKPATRAGAKMIGKFDDWTAATHSEAGQTVCYAFVRAQTSAPVIPGRSEVVLTVTQRPSGRDAVALSAGFAYAQNAEVQMLVDKAELPFYTSARSAFARDGHAVTVAFAAARQATAKSPGPKNAPVADTFSLRGFSAAYAAINKACPVK